MDPAQRSLEYMGNVPCTPTSTSETQGTPSTFKGRARVRSIHCRFIGGLAAALLLFGSAVSAQPPAYADVPDRFRVEAGGFRIGSDTELSFNTSGGVRPPVDFESLDVPESTTRFYIEGFWRPWRRHQFSLSWYRNNRDGDPTTSQREFNWGNQVIQAGATVIGHVGSHYLSGVYRFAAYKNDRFEIGPSVGIGLLSLDAAISGEGSVRTPVGDVSLPFDESKSLDQATGDLGGYFYWWPARRLLARGDLRYIYVSPENAKASITDGRAAVVYHFVPHVGLGVQYTYTKFRYDRDVLATELGGRLRYSGVQLVLSGAF